jgi:mRNA interferase MazF
VELVKRFEVYWTNLEPTKGSEIRKTRPCVIVSPDDLNQHLNTVIVSPLTTTAKTYPYRVPCQVKGKKGWIALDQLRAVDKARLVRKLDTLPNSTATKVLEVLQEMFSP